MIGTGLAFLINPFGRWAAIDAMVFAVCFGFAPHFENKGASRVVADIEKKFEANEQ